MEIDITVEENDSVIEIGVVFRRPFFIQSDYHLSRIIDQVIDRVQPLVPLYTLNAAMFVYYDLSGLSQPRFPSTIDRFEILIVKEKEWLS